jgi:hypothetical protein
MRYLIGIFTTTLLCACIGATAHAQNAPERPARQAQCYLEVNNVYYFGGDCSFAPLDKVGSFRITDDKGLSAQVRVKEASNITKPGIASWSGTNGGDAAAINVGEIYNTGRGCWRTDDHTDPWKWTFICAWDKDQRLYLGPMRADPRWSLLWGQNTGTYARIISSSGLDTEQAIIVAEKARDGAIEACRAENDFSTTYTDFLGRNLKRLDDDILDVDNNSRLGFSPPLNDWDVARTAFEALCPKTAGPKTSP